MGHGLAVFKTEIKARIMMTEANPRLVILREKRDYGALDLFLEKKFFPLYYAPIFNYEFVVPTKRPSSSSVLLFSSRAGVRAVSSVIRQMEKAHCFVIGEETQNALRASGFQGKIECFLTIQDFLDHLVRTKRKDVRAVHYYRGDVVKMPNLGNHLFVLGIKYSEDIVYKTSLVQKIPQEICGLIKESRYSIGYLAFSQRGITQWDHLIFSHGLAPFYSKGHLFCLSKDVASGSGIMPESSTTVPLEPTTTSLIACIQSYYQSSPDA
jgi:uroporphyrinogen-III synthase